MADNVATAAREGFSRWFSTPEHGFCRALAGHRWNRRAGIEVTEITRERLQCGIIYDFIEERLIFPPITMFEKEIVLPNRRRRERL